MLKFILKGSIGTVDIVELQGELLKKTMRGARDKFFERLKQGVTDIVLLCREFKQIDSNGVSLLIEICDYLQPRGGKLHLVNCQRKVVLPMQKLGMKYFFQFYKTEEEAFQALEITREQIKGMFQKPGDKSVPGKTKRKVAIRDHIRNKMILFKHYETALIKDVIAYLQSTYAHFRDQEIELNFQGQRLPEHITLLQLYRDYHYTDQLLDIQSITSESLDLQEMIKRGGKLYGRGILGILEQQQTLEKELLKSIKEISELNQESVVTTIVEGNYLSESVLANTIVNFLHWTLADLEKLSHQAPWQLFDREKAIEYCVFPLKQEKDTLWLATTNPFDEKQLEELRKLTTYEIEPLFALETAIRRKIDENADNSWQKKTSYLGVMDEHDVETDESANKEQETSSKSEKTSYLGVMNARTLRDEKISEPQMTRYLAVMNESSMDEKGGNHAEQQPTLQLQEVAITGTVSQFWDNNLAMVAKLEKNLQLFSDFYTQLPRAKSTQEVVDSLVLFADSVLPVENAVIFIEEEGNWIVQSGSEKTQHLNNDEQSVSKDLLQQVSSGKNMVVDSKGKQMHLGIPLVVTEKVLGIFYLIVKETKDCENIQLLTTFSQYVSLIIENQRLKQVK